MRLAEAVGYAMSYALRTLPPSNGAGRARGWPEESFGGVGGRLCGGPTAHRGWEDSYGAVAAIMGCCPVSAGGDGSSGGTILATHGAVTSGMKRNPLP